MLEGRRKRRNEESFRPLRQAGYPRVELGMAFQGWRIRNRKVLQMSPLRISPLCTFSLLLCIGVFSFHVSCITKWLLLDPPPTKTRSEKPQCCYNGKVRKRAESSSLEEHSKQHCHARPSSSAVSRSFPIISEPGEDLWFPTNYCGCETIFGDT